MADVNPIINYDKCKWIKHPTKKRRQAERTFKKIQLYAVYKRHIFRFKNTNGLKEKEWKKNIM